MLKVLRQSAPWTLLLCLSSSLVVASASAQVTATDRQLRRLDLSINGIGQFTKGVEGTNYQGVVVNQSASTTLGALGTIRYTRSPLLGAEFNYSYARFTERFRSTPTYIASGVQANASEASFGYVAHGPELFGFHTFGAAGVGSLIFSPTGGGGQSLPKRARLAYYYTVGIEEPLLSSHFGIRVQFRQVFYKAPDFDQNYLTINRRTFTTEPGIGLYLHF